MQYKLTSGPSPHLLAVQGEYNLFETSVLIIQAPRSPQADFFNAVATAKRRLPWNSKYWPWMVKRYSEQTVWDPHNNPEGIIESSQVRRP